MPSAQRPLNYTTKILVGQTTGECISLLARAGASAVGVEYDPHAQPVGLSFRLDTPHGRRDFSLPVNIDGVYKMLQQAKADGMFAGMHIARDQYTSREHAAKVAWRVVKDWLEANLALIAAQMATLDEVMLPYLHVDESRTLYQAYREHEQMPALLPGGGQ